MSNELAFVKNEKCPPHPDWGVMNRISKLLNNPLVRNGYALILSAGITSLLGLGFWVLAARMLDKQHLGIGAALLTSMTTIGSIAQLNLGNVLNRFLPIAGHRRVSLIYWSYAVAACMAIVLAAVFAATAQHVLPEIGFIFTDPLLAFGFTGAAALWTIYALQERVLSGLRKALWIPLVNAIYAVSKIVLLFVFLDAAFAASSVFFAWTAPLVVLVLVVNYAIFRYFVFSGGQEQHASTVNRASLAAFFGFDYVGTLAFMLAIGVIPIIVLKLGGAQTMAEYHLGWTISYSLYLISRSMSVSLLTEGVIERHRLRELVSQALLHTMCLVVPAVVVIAVGAELIMMLFGENYAGDSAILLRFLVFSCIPWSFVTIYLSAARITGRVKDVAGVQAVTLVLVCTLSPLLMIQMGVAGIGLAWLVTHSTISVALVLLHVYRHGTKSLLEWCSSLGTSLSRIVSRADL